MLKETAHGEREDVETLYFSINFFYKLKTILRKTKPID